jgi:hypothetical protein
MRKRRKFNDGADLEAQLRGHRAKPTDEFVDRLSRSVAAERRAPQRAWSRLAFASAVSVFMLGTFASFGGLSYAASGASGTYHAVKQVASGKLLVSVKKSSAADEYGKPPPKPPTATVGGVQKTLGAGVKSGGTLPFTGLSLLTTFFISLALIVAGLALRRRERRN